MDELGVRKCTERENIFEQHDDPDNKISTGTFTLFDGLLEGQFRSMWHLAASMRTIYRKRMIIYRQPRRILK